MHARFSRRCLNLVVVAAVAAVHLPLAAGADPLVWKFSPGMTNRYRLTLDNDMSMDIGEGGEAVTKMHQVIDTSWTVDKVNDDGSAAVTQQIDRMQMSIDAAGQEAKIDSASKDPPEGHAALLVPLFKAMTSAPFKVRMTPQGEIKDIEVPEEIVKALANAPGAALMGDMATSEGFKKLVSQSSFSIPAKLEAGQEWSKKMDTKLPMIGTQLAETTYRYEGEKEVEGRRLEAFKPTLVLSYSGGDAEVVVDGQESSGEILFDREAGRLESSRLKHGVDLTIKVQAQSIQQKIDQSIEMKWVPEKD